MTSWRPRLPRPAGRSGEGPARPAPLHQRITDALAADVAAGRLKPGTRLPTQRDLADLIGTTVATVTRSYAEARRRGLVDATVGRGTFVRETVYAPPPAAIVDLTVNSLAPAPFAPELAAAASSLVDRDGLNALLHYQPHEGHRRHREAGAAWVRTRGVPAEPGEIVVTAGAQHAMLVALATTTRPGDPVLVEALTYPGLTSLANHLQLRPEPVPLDAEGLLPDALDAAASRTRARVLYTMPTLHNPTGVTMSAARRRALVEIAARRGLTLIEDDQYGFLSDSPPIASEAPHLCCYVASLSKSVVPGLRVGYLRAPAALVAPLGAAVFASAVMAPPLGAELAARWIADGTAARVVEWKRSEFAARAARARKVLGCPAAPAAPHVWLPIARGLTALEAVEQVRLRGVLVSGSQAFAVGRERPVEAVRICLGPPPTRDVLDRALETIAGALSEPPRAHRGLV
jgi:DNA-binding transcriptional MocR family regulator